MSLNILTTRFKRKINSNTYKVFSILVVMKTKRFSRDVKYKLRINIAIMLRNQLVP